VNDEIHEGTHPAWLDGQTNSLAKAKVYRHILSPHALDRYLINSIICSSTNVQSKAGPSLWKLKQLQLCTTF